MFLIGICNYIYLYYLLVYVIKLLTLKGCNFLKMKNYYLALTYNIILVVMVPIIRYPQS